MLRPSFPELMHGLFWFAMALTILGVGIKSCTVLDGMEKRMLQGNLHHEKIMAMADKSLADHAATIDLIVRTHRTIPNE